MIFDSIRKLSKTIGSRSLIAKSFAIGSIRLLSILFALSASAAIETAPNWTESEPPIRFKSRDWADAVLAAASTNSSIAIEGGRLLASATWSSERTHLVFNTVYVPSGITLTISEGAVVKFCPGTMIKVEDGGKLSIVGASGNDVILTAANDATVGEAIAGLSDEAIAFDGIRLQSSGATFTDNSHLETRGFNYGSFPTVSVLGTEAVRNGGVAYIPFTLSGSTRETAFSVEWEAVAGTAKYGEDYTLASGTISWGKSSEGTKTLQIPLNAANVTGEERTFTVRIKAARCSNIGTRTATVKIVERDALTLEWAGEWSESEPPIRFKSRDWADAVLAAAGTNSSIAIEGGRLLTNTTWDSTKTHLVFNTVYVPSGVTLTISEGAIVKFCPETMIKVEDGGKLNIVGASGNDVILTAANDATVGEAIAGLTPEQSIAFDGIRLQSTSATFTDNGWLETRGFNYGAYPSVTLNDSTAFRSSGLASIPVTISGTRDQTLTIDWVAEDGTAKYGEDYTLASGRITWGKASEGTKTISIPLVTSHIVGATTSFKIKIVTARGANIADGECTVSIREFDTLNIESGSAESTPPIRFKSRDWADAVLAAASTNSSIAIEGGRLLANTTWDATKTHLVFNTVYVPSGVTLTISAGAVVKFCPGTMIKVEDGGKLNVVGASGNDVILTAANDATAGEAIAGLGDEPIVFGGIRLQSTAATFTDNGWLETRGFNYGAYPSVTLHDATANRKAGMVYLPVTVGGTTRNQSFTVDWVAEDESAQFGRDYATHNSGRLTWSKSGDGTKYITIPLVTTENAGSNRTFKVRFVVARGVNVTDGEATVTIAEFAFDGLNGQPVVITTNAVSSTEFAIKESIGSQPIFLNDVEQVRYSGKWQTYDKNEAAALRVTVDSDNGTKVLKECSVTETGSFELRQSDYATGFYTLKHEILNNLGETLATKKKSFSIIDTEDVELHGGILTQSETWSADKVHVVYETVTVPAAYTLFIEPGAIVKFMTGTGIEISQGGALFANKIVFTHINDDTIGGDTLSDGYTVAPPMDAYTLSGNFTFGDDTELRNITQNTALTGTISTRKVLSRGSTYRVSGTVTIANGGSLTIPPGTVLKMESGASIVVNSGATLTAVGTRAAPIIITSIKDDSVSGDTNGDGDKTIPQPGDWRQIRVAGGAFSAAYLSMFYLSNDNNQGGLYVTGGEVKLDCCTIAHCNYDCMRTTGGVSIVENSIFADASIGVAPNGGVAEYRNCIFNGLTTAVRWPSGVFVNCVFSDVAAIFFDSIGSSPVKNCLLWNTEGYGPQTDAIVGKNGNIWGDPLFIDSDNGDFRIEEGSPCVDAADSSVAPEFDYYGQPRITVTEQGTNTVGQLADIGICELMPRNVTSDIDLVPQNVRTVTNAVPGELLFVKWEVKNAGGKELEGAWRDTVSLVSSNGREVVLGNKTTSGVIAPGGSIFCSGYFTIPPISEGEWYPKVNVNSYRDVFEGALGVNNALVDDRALTVMAEALDPSVAREGVIGGGTPSVVKLTFGADDENRMVKFDVPAGVKVTWGFGFMPQGASQSGSMTATDGGVMFRVPEGATDVYVVLESDKTATYEMTTESTKMVITGVAPNMLPSSGTTTLVITGAGFGETNAVILASDSGGRVVLNAPQKDASGNLIATVDCSTLTPGAMYDLIVSNGNVLVRAAAAITTLSESGSWNIAYDMEIPGFVREQRVFSGWIVFENTGNIDAPLPIFILSSDDNNTSFMTSSHSAVWRTKLSLLGVSYTGQTSVKPGEKCRIPFYAKVTSDRAGSISIAVLEETRTVDYNDVCALMNFDASDYALMQKVRGLYGLNWSDFADSIRQFVIKYPNIVEIDYDINALVNRFLTEYDGKRVYGRLNTTTSIPKDIKMMLYNVSDNCETPTVTAVTYCDTEGVFCFQNITNGNYCIRAESVNNEPCLIEMSDSSEDVSAVLNQQPFGMINIALPLGAETYSTNLVLTFENRLTHEQVKYKVPCGVNSVTVDNLYSGEYSVTLFGDGQLLSSVDLVRVSDANISLDFAPVDFLTLSGTVLSNEGELIDAVIKVGNKTYRTDSLTGNFSFNVISNDCILLCCSAEGYESHVERIEDFSENKIVYMTRAYKVHGQVLFDGMAVPIGTIIEFSNGERSIPCLTLKDGLYTVELGPGAWNARYVNSEGNEFNQSFFVETPIELNLKFESIINSQSKGLRSLSNFVDTVKLYAIEEYCFLVASAFASTYGLIGGYFESAQLLNLYLGVRGHNLGKRVSPVNYGVDSEISKLAKSKNEGFVCSYSSVFNEVQAVIKATLKSGCLGGCGRVNKKVDYNGNIFSPLFATFGGTKGTAYEYSAKKIGEDDVSITYYVNVVTTLFDTYEFYGHKDSISVKMIILADVGWATVFETSLSIKDEFVCIVEKDDDPSPGEGEKEGYFTIPQSCDPNEMAGPLGLGDPNTERFVKPGEWMTYTVYFENMTNATAAAQEVYVTNPLSEWLDWSTFEMGEVSFGNQIDLGLSGKASGTTEKRMDGTNWIVRTELSIEPDTTATDSNRQQKMCAKWYLRIVDPTTSTGWPVDPVAGFLPPNNPETHCGEGHLTYRIKLRDDAPSGLVITNSATIVFDYNEPITTDPAWWNTVAPETLATEITPDNVTANEGESFEFKVFGGNLTKQSSVQVQLAYNTASAADINLKELTIDGAAVKNAKFPLTLTWAAGEIGEKTISVPVAADKATEADEFFTLQLADPKNMSLGDVDTTTVTIHDPGYDALKAKVDGGTATSKELSEWFKLHPGKLYVRPLAAPATGGKVSGGALVQPGKKASLKATANAGYVFAGWYTNAMCAAGQELVGYGDYRNPSLAYLADELDVDIFARFIPVEEDYLTLGDNFLPSEITTNAQVSIYVPVESASLPDIKVSGLPSGLKFYAKETVVKATKTTPAYTIAANTIYGIAPKRATTGPSTVTVTVKNAGKYAIARKYQLSIIEGEAGGDSAEVVSDALKFYSLAVELSDDFAGKVTGMGVYQSGKKVTVKATANKGYVFNGWYYSGTDVSPEAEGRAAKQSLEVCSAVEENAQAARSTMGEELLSQAASYAFNMPEEDVALIAKFVTAEEDAASVSLGVDALGGELNQGAFVSVTNMCGVALRWSISADALSQPTVAVSGLPTGLKFTAKDIMKKGSKTEIDIPANTIYGAPTAESKLDAKTGLRKPSAVKFTVTTAGKSKRIYPVDMTILPLPDWAVGSFNGGGDLGQVSLTVAKTGKLSGKYLSEGLTWTLASDSFDSIDESGDVYRATLIGKSGKLVMTNDVGVACDAMGGFAESLDYIAYQNNWKLEPWKTIGKPFAKAAALEYEDSASVAGVPVPGVLTLKFAASGAVTVKGSFVTGVNERTGKDIIYTASGSAVLAPQSEPDETGVFDAVVFVYLPPKAGNFDGYVRCIGVRWTGEGWVKLEE